ncbi:MAG: hypothetical protein OEW19_13125 [Acidobacteriota bacterium]|nr:hypothetical protein [Acidobacteriota bacterium]
MGEPVVRAAGAAFTVAYGVLILWLAASHPQSVSEVTGGLAASIGVYRADQVALGDGLRFFRQDKFVEARAAFARADPAGRDARTQFYVAYSYYRQGWGRLGHDDALYADGLQAIDRAIAAAPDGRLVVDDPELQLRTGDELRAELAAGMTREWSDFNPLRVFEGRK